MDFCPPNQPRLLLVLELKDRLLTLDLKDLLLVLQLEDRLLKLKVDVLLLELEDAVLLVPHLEVLLLLPDLLDHRDEEDEVRLLLPHPLRILFFGSSLSNS